MSVRRARGGRCEHTYKRPTPPRYRRSPECRRGLRQAPRIQPLKLRQHEHPIPPHEHPIEPDLPSTPLRGLDEDQVPVDGTPVAVVAVVLVGVPWSGVQTAADLLVIEGPHDEHIVRHPPCFAPPSPGDRRGPASLPGEERIP